MTTLGLEYSKFKEAKRSNLAREFETNRNNTAVEAETHRSNLRNEELKQGTLDEQIRTNMANELIKRDTLEETNRHNERTEDLESEKNRINQQQADAKTSEVKERARANKAEETFKSIQSLPPTSAKVAALSTFLKNYGGDISSKDRAKIDKYLNLATTASAGSDLWQSYLNQGFERIGQIFKFAK